MLKIVKLIIIHIFFLLVLPSISLAHKIYLLAYEDSGTIYCESSFSDGRPVVNAKISVKNFTGELIAQGKTNQQGLFEFSPTTNQDNLEISIDTMMGHKASTVIVKQASK